MTNPLFIFVSISINTSSDYLLLLFILSNRDQISSLQENETIKYLGVDFKDEINFDESNMLKQIHNDLEFLRSSPALRPEQKIKNLNEYLWPKVIYPFQNAPLGKLNNLFLRKLDLMIRSAAKEILGLPSDTPNSMLYSPNNMT